MTPKKIEFLVSSTMLRLYPMSLSPLPLSIIVPIPKRKFQNGFELSLVI